MPKISKPDANPVVAALLCLILGLGHFLINGQQKKWLVNLAVIWGLGIAISILVSILARIAPSLAQIFGLLSLVPFAIGICSIIEAYKTAEKLKAGKEIGENEYAFGPCHKVMSLVDKDAVLVAA